MLSFLRFLLGHFSSQLKLNEILRTAFLLVTRLQMKIFLDSNLRIYFRRSITNKNFIPFWSDIDITVIIVETNLSRLREALKKIRLLTVINPFLKDIEMVDGAYFNEWLIAGGYKNWIRSNWKNYQEIPQLEDVDYVSLPDEELIYTLIWEHRFLYEQLNIKLNKFAQGQFSQVDLINAYKLLADIEILVHFWNDKRLIERRQVLTNYSGYLDLNKLFLDKEKFNNHVHFIITHFSLLTEKLVAELNLSLPESEEFSYLEEWPKINALNDKITFFQRPCFFVGNFNDTNWSLNLSRGDTTVLTPKLYKLYKLCGVQELDHIVKLIDKTTYKFLKNTLSVRMLQDYLQAIVGEKNESVLLFCRKNTDKLFYTRLHPDEALSYCKRAEEDNLEHYFRVREKILML